VHAAGLLTFVSGLVVLWKMKETLETNPSTIKKDDPCHNKNPEKDETLKL
jgi:hypothetical protein